MANRIITRSGPILVKSIKSGIPTNLYNTIQSFPNVQGEPSTSNPLLVWDSDQNKFIFGTTATAQTSGIRAVFSAGNNLDYDSAVGKFSLSTNSNLDGLIGTYGSASQIPVFTIDSHGLIDSIGSVTVAGVTNLIYNDSNGLLSISTADGNTFSDSISLSPFSTTDLIEGDNLYYTTTRVDSAIDVRVDSDFVRAFIDQAFINTFDTHDSAAIQGMIDATLAITDTHDSAAVQGQINATVNQAFIDQFDTHDSAAIQAMIDATTTIDADTVDGIHANQFLRSDTADTIDGDLTLSNGTKFIIGTGTNPLTVTYETVPQAAYFRGNNWAFADSDGDTFINAVNTGTESIVQLRHNGNTKLETSDSGLDITGDAMISGDALLTNIDASGNVAAAGTITTSDLITFEGDSATVANLTTAIVATAAMISVQAIEATVVSVNAVSGERQVSRVLLTHDTTDTYMNEYAVINTGASDEFTLDADTSGGNFRLKLDNISGNTLFAKSSIIYL